MTVRSVATLTRPFDLEIRLPGAKSIANRALICASLADGVSRLAHVPDSDDTAAMIVGLRALGAEVVLGAQPGRSSAGWVDLGAEIRGTGGHLAPGPLDLDAGLAGTTSRFLTAVAALGPGPYRIDGGPSLRRRPMGPLHDALRELGASVVAEGDEGRLPVVVRGGRLRGGRLRMPGHVSSQLLSALAMVAPLLAHGLRIEATTPVVSGPYLRLTAKVIEDFGAGPVEVMPRSMAVPEGRYRSSELPIEPDASTASYFAAAAAVTGSRVNLLGLSAGSRQADVAFLDVLSTMGAAVERCDEGTVVTGTGVLEGVDVDMVGFSDSVPTLAVTATFARGPTRIRGVGFIRGKESDRIGAVVAELRRCGIRADETDDGLIVRPGRPTPARVRTHDDHRLAMAFALLGLRVPGIEIDQPEVVSKSFPAFWDTWQLLGGG